jgi:hypothetical protein
MPEYRKGRFQKGQSGNPAGRRAGSRSGKALLVDALLDDQAEALAAKAIARAMEGDAALLRHCLDRISPPRRDRPVSFELPAMQSAADAAQAGARIAAGLAAGELTPGEATHLAGFIETYVKALEATEFEARLRKLEAAAEEGDL